MEEITNSTPTIPQTNSRLNTILVVGAIFIIGIMGLILLQNQAGPNTPPVTNPNTEVTGSPVASPATSPTASPLTASPSPEENQMRTINIEAGSFYFSPAEVRVKKGERVKVVMTAADMMHNFMIDELDVNMPLVNFGETGTVEFTVDQVGQFEYYCGVGQHRANGQVGTLIVE